MCKKLFVASDRKFEDVDLLKIKLTELFITYPELDTVYVCKNTPISEDVKEITINNNKTCAFVAPRYDLYGDEAEYHRDKYMWELIDIGLVFWDGISSSSSNSIALSKVNKKKMELINYNMDSQS